MPNADQAVFLILAQLLLMLERRELLDPADTAEVFDRAMDGAAAGTAGVVALVANLTNALRPQGPELPSG